MQRRNLIVFDFDGTIADSVPAALHILNDLGRAYKIPHVDSHLAAELKHKSIKELMNMSGLSWLQLPGFLRKAQIRFRHMIHEVMPIEGMPELIRHLQREEVRMGILTSNREDNVRDFLARFDLEGFEFVECSTSLFGKAKKLRRIIKQTRVPAHEIVMIGDELRDMEAAKRVGVESVAVTWGFNSAELLQSASPDHLVYKTEELAQLLFSPSNDGSR